MSGSPIVTRTGFAVSLVSTSAGSRDLNRHSESGSFSSLATHLPAWLTRMRRSQRHNLLQLQAKRIHEG
jgi:hypothetical protein